MHPHANEIEEVGQAFITLTTPEYTPEQQSYLNSVLNEYVHEIDKDELAKIFEGNAQIIEAIKTLNDFVLQYQDEKDIIDEFNEEIENLLITINQYDDGITF